MKIKLTLKSFVISASLAMVAVIIVAFSILAAVTYKPVAAFYGISEKNQEAIVSVLQRSVKTGKKSVPFKIVTLDDNLSLEKALKKSKADLLFVEKGLNCEYAQKKAEKRHTGLSETVLDGMISHVVKAAPLSKGKVTAVPLLMDNYELIVNLEKYNASSVDKLVTIEEAENLAKITKSSTPYRFVFASGDDKEFIDIFGAFVELTAGKEAYDSAVNKIRQNIASGKSSFNSYVELINELSMNGGEFSEAVALLSKWKQAEILPKNISNIQLRDIKSFAASNLCTMAVISLSDHRSFDRSIISQYGSTFIPSLKEGDKRSFCVPLIMGLPLSKNKTVQTALYKLADGLQSDLSFSTGLAPVQSKVAVPDVQADDVRFWVAASETPSVPLSSALFVTKQQRAVFAEALRMVIR